MRSIFLLLVLVNLLFFSWTLGYFGELASGREPQRLDQQLHPESVRLVSTPTGATVSSLCRRLSGFATPQDAETLKTELDAALGKSGGWTVTLNNGARAMEYWVGIPALTTAALAEKKRSELTAAKYAGLKTIEESKGGPYTILISQFPDEAAAKRFLESQNKTLRTARMITRESDAKSTLDVSGPGRGFEQRVKELLGARVLALESCNTNDGAR